MLQKYWEPLRVSDQNRLSEIYISVQFVEQDENSVSPELIIDPLKLSTVNPQIYSDLLSVRTGIQNSLILLINIA